MTLLAPHQRLAAQAPASAFTLAFASGPLPTAIIHVAPNPRARLAPRFRPSRSALLANREAGTTTAEYAIGTLAACAFAAVLYKILTGGWVAEALGGLIHRALGLAG
jgi:hypothetical protein